MREFFLPEDVGKQESKDGSHTRKNMQPASAAPPTKGLRSRPSQTAGGCFQPEGLRDSFYLDTHHISGQD